MPSLGGGGEIKSVVLVARLTVFMCVRGAEGMTFARGQRKLKGSTACADDVARAPRNGGPSIAHSPSERENRDD